MLEIEWTPEGGQTQTIDFDASVEEVYEGAAEVTEHAVESGANISDHVRPENETLSIEAMVTNTPVIPRTFGMDGATGETQSASLGGSAGGVSVLQFSQTFDRVRAVDDALRQLKDDGQVLTVRTTFREITDVVLTRYKVTRNVDFSHALNLNLDLKRVRIATTERVAVRPPRPHTHNHARQANRGSQPGTQETDDRSASLRILEDTLGIHI